MRKNLFLIAGIAMSFFFAACSNEDVVLDEQTTDWTNSFDEEGNAYLRFAVTTPTSGSTRAAGYDNEGGEYGNYADGTETDVVNAYIAIYGQKYAHDSEEDFTCLKVYSLGTMTWNPADEIWISKKAENQVVQINENTAAGNVGLWALVILNTNGEWSLPAAGDKFADWRNATSAGITGLASAFDGKGFYMSNMPYANASNGAATTVKALYPVNLNYIYKTRDEAVNGVVATVVNVERGVAKVEVTESDAAQSLNGATYEYGNWFVDNYNTVAYNIRHCALQPNQYVGNTTYGYLNYQLPGKVNPYRFVLPTAITTGAYRTAWAVDPNYNVDAAAELTKITDPTVGAAASNPVQAGKYSYFHENTFPVNKQTEPNTTRVIVPVKFTLASGDPGFYTLLSDPDKVYSVEDAQARVYEIMGVTPAVSSWYTTHFAGTVDLDEIIDVTLSETAGVAEVTIAPKASQPGGVTLVAGYDWDDCVADFPTAAVKTYVDTHETFTFYEGGVAYYRILIQHFGAHDTPWQANAETMTSNTPALIYGYTEGNEATAEQNYLGRYGAVRNNWYRISIDGVSKIGSAVIPSISNNTDDAVEDAYIKYTINMVPWVIRTQTVTLH